MSNDPVLKVTRLGKRFKIYNSPRQRMREWVSVRRRSYHTPFWANREISFEVEKGEFFGIIGVNGAGKSTLLKILSGILLPTEGSYQLGGQVLSLLELGGNFKQDLTGRENILRAAQLLNLPKGYIEEQIEKMILLNIVKRIADGQLDECNVSTSDIAKIVETLTHSIEATFHSRVTYPWQEKKKN